MFPPRDQTTICFAHVAYPLQEIFTARNTGIASFQVTTREDLRVRLPEADALVISGLWQNDLVAHGTKLRFVQTIGAGTDQFARAPLIEKNIRLASASGVNARAVSEHAIALILALARRLPEARDNQHKKFWRGMIGDLTRREDELGGKTIAIVGLGKIGGRLVQLAKAFDMHVIGLRQHPDSGPNGADEVHGIDRLHAVLPRADIVALTCPLTPQTEGLIDARAFALMKPLAYLINVARGRVVVEADLIAALAANRIAGAGIDVTHDEPLPETSPLWAMDNAVITPHSAGETRRYEENLLDILLDNLDRLWSGHPALRNQII